MRPNPRKAESTRRRQGWATQKYNEKAGLHSKTYKLPITVTGAFKTACDARGEPQSKVLIRLMTEYIDSHAEELLRTISEQ
jgi:hypothetical protein